MKIKNTKNSQENSNVQDVKFEDLIVAKKNGKFAIFNKENSTFITNHEFDKILLSKSGHHIAFRTDDFINETDENLEYRGKITYSVVIDNYGNIKEFEDIDFGFYGEFIEDICPALYKKTGKVHLVNYNKGIISDGFEEIVPLNKRTPLGIYTAYDYDEKTKLKKLSNLLFEDGSIIDVNVIYGSACGQMYEITDINNFDKMLEFIKKYGANIIELTPWFIFTTLNSYNKILLTINKYYPHQLVDAIRFLEYHTLQLNDKKYDGLLNNTNDDKDNNFYDTIESNKICTYKITQDYFDYGITADEINIINIIESEDIKMKIDSLFDRYNFLIKQT